MRFWSCTCRPRWLRETARTDQESTGVCVAGSATAARNCPMYLNVRWRVGLWVGEMDVMRLESSWAWCAVGDMNVTRKLVSKVAAGRSESSLADEDSSFAAWVSRNVRGTSVEYSNCGSSDEARADAAPEA